MRFLIRKRILFLCLLLILIAPTNTFAYSAYGNLTLPFANDGQNVGSWFDHIPPFNCLYNCADTDNFQRYDGPAWLNSESKLGNCTQYVNCYNGHDGFDYNVVPEGTIVRATDAGVITKGFQSGGFGNYLRIEHKTPAGEPYGYSTIYAHLYGYLPGSDDNSAYRGEDVALSGCTGLCTGAHLHFGAYDTPTSWDPIDPYGWSGTSSYGEPSSDPYARGRAWGYLFGKRIGVVNTASPTEAYVKDGTQWADPGAAQATSVTDVELAGQRIGVISGGNANVKDGETNDSQWVTEWNGATQLVMHGRLIGIVTSDNKAYVKWGDLDACWITCPNATIIAENVSKLLLAEISIDPNNYNNNVYRVGVITTGGRFDVKEGLLTAEWKILANNVVSADMDGGPQRRMGVVKGSSENGEVWMREGAMPSIPPGDPNYCLNNPPSACGWVVETNGAIQIAVGGNRFAIIVPRGTPGQGQVNAKEGSLTSPTWYTNIYKRKVGGTLEERDVTQVRLNEARIAVRATDAWLETFENEFRFLDSNNPNNWWVHQSDGSDIEVN